MFTNKFDFSDVTPGLLAILGFLCLFFGVFLFYPLLHVFLNAFYVDDRFSSEFFSLIRPKKYQVCGLIETHHSRFRLCVPNTSTWEVMGTARISGPCVISDRARRMLCDR